MYETLVCPEDDSYYAPECNYKRSAPQSLPNFATALEASLATLPTAETLESFVSDGAKLAHKHMGIQPFNQAALLHLVMSKIMGTTKRRSGAMSMVRHRSAVRADVLATALHKKIVDESSEHDRPQIDALATRALTRAARERLETNTWSWGLEDFDVLHHIFDRVRGHARDEL